MIRRRPHGRRSVEKKLGGHPFLEPGRRLSFRSVVGPRNPNARDGSRIYFNSIRELPPRDSSTKEPSAREPSKLCRQEPPASRIVAPRSDDIGTNQNVTIRRDIAMNMKAAAANVPHVHSACNNHLGLPCFRSASITDSAYCANSKQVVNMAGRTFFAAAGKRFSIARMKRRWGESARASPSA